MTAPDSANKPSTNTSLVLGREVTVRRHAHGSESGMTQDHTTAPSPPGASQTCLGMYLHLSGVHQLLWSQASQETTQNTQHIHVLGLRQHRRKQWVSFRAEQPPPPLCVIPAPSRRQKSQSSAQSWYRAVRHTHKLDLWSSGFFLQNSGFSTTLSTHFQIFL